MTPSINDEELRHIIDSLAADVQSKTETCASLDLELLNASNQPTFNKGGQQLVIDPPSYTQDYFADLNGIVITLVPTLVRCSFQPKTFELDLFEEAFKSTSLPKTIPSANNFTCMIMSPLRVHVTHQYPSIHNTTIATQYKDGTTLLLNCEKNSSRLNLLPTTKGHP